MAAEVPKETTEVHDKIQEVKEALKQLRETVEKQQKEKANPSKEEKEIDKRDTELNAAIEKLGNAYLSFCDKNKVKGELPPAIAEQLVQELMKEKGIQEIATVLVDAGFDTNVQDLGKRLQNAKEKTPEGEKSQAVKISESISAYIETISGQKGFNFSKKTQEAIADGLIDVIIKVLEKLSVIPAAAEVAGELKFMQMQKKFLAKAPEPVNAQLREEQVKQMKEKPEREKYIAAYINGENPTYRTALGLPEKSAQPAEAPKAGVVDATKERNNLKDDEKQLLETKDLRKLNILKKKDGEVTIQFGDKKEIAMKERMDGVSVVKATTENDAMIIFKLKDNKGEVIIKGTELADAINNVNEETKNGSVKSREPGQTLIEFSLAS